MIKRPASRGLLQAPPPPPPPPPSAPPEDYSDFTASGKRTLNIPGAPIQPSKYVKTQGLPRPGTPLIQATIFSEKGELRTGQTRHEGVIIQKIILPEVLPSLDTWARFLSTKNLTYSGNLPMISLDGCFFSYKMTLHVSPSGKPGNFKIIRVESVERLPLNYALLEQIYFSWVRSQTHNRQIRPDPCYRDLRDSMEWFRSNCLLAALFTEDKPEMPLEIFVAENKLDDHDQLQTRENYRPLPINTRILRMHPHLSSMVESSDYFLDGPASYRVFNEAWGPGFRHIYPNELLQKVGLVLTQSPLDLFFRSTNTFPVDCLTEKALPHVARIDIGNLLAGDQVKVLAYSAYRKALKRPDILSSSCVPKYLCKLNAEALAQLMDMNVLSETQILKPGSVSHIDVVQDVADMRAEARLSKNLTKWKQMQKGERPPIELAFTRKLDTEQTKAFWSCFTNGLTVMDARPGYGKSFTMARAILASAFHLGERVLVVAPTGQGVEVVIQSLEECLETLPREYKTLWEENLPWVNEDMSIHDIEGSFMNTMGVGRIVICTMQSVNYDIEVKGEGFGDRLWMPLFNKVFIDECSIAALDMMDSFLYHLNTNANIVLSGDCGQMPSIEGPSVFHTIVGMLEESPEKCPPGWRLCRLTTLYRINKGDSRVIYENLDRIRSRNVDWAVPETEGVLSPWNMVQCDSLGYERLMDLISQTMCKNRLNRTQLFDSLMIITYFNKDRVEINRRIRERFYKPEKSYEYGFFQKHEPVVFRRKLKSITGRIFNNSKGRITKIEAAVRIDGETVKSQQKLKEAILTCKEIEWIEVDSTTPEIWSKCRIELTGRKSMYLMNAQFKDIDLAFALTTYGAQGGQANFVGYYLTQLNEYLNIQLPVSSVYTAISRAKQRVAVIGDIARLKKSIENSPPVINYSTLPTLVEKIVDSNGPTLRNIQTT